MAGESDITQNTLLICKGQELTMSPTQGQADNIERTIPYQPFRSPQGDSCMAGYLCLMPTAFHSSKTLHDKHIPFCPCHNDAVPENFLKAKDGTVFLIDWEYSGMNDPMADFAALFLESNFTDENQDYILGHYFESDIPINAKLKIQYYQVLWDYLWAQWTVIKEARGDNFGTYGIDRYKRACTNYNKLIGKKHESNR